MKTIALIFGLALSLAGLNLPAASFSSNSVGYVKVTVPTNQFALLGVPLSGSNNLLNTTIRLPDEGFDGVQIFRWDVETQNYREAIQWFDNFGWFSPSDDAPTVDPGEGIWLYNTTTNVLNFRFAGSIMGGSYDQSIQGANNPLSYVATIVSSKVPKALNLNDLGFPGAQDDVVYVFNVASQGYDEAYQYFDGFGWFSPSPNDPGPGGPVIKVATGFWILKPGPAVPWPQIYSVN